MAIQAVQAVLSSTGNAKMLAQFLASGSISAASSSSQAATLVIEGKTSTGTSSRSGSLSGSSTSTKSSTSSTASTSGSSGSTSSTVSLLYDRRDTNQDGVVTTLEEILYGLKHPSLLSGSSNSSARIYDRRDANQDGAISYVERLMYERRYPEINSTRTASITSSQLQSGLRAYQQSQALGSSPLSSSFFQV